MATIKQQKQIVLNAVRKKSPSYDRGAGKACWTNRTIWRATRLANAATITKELFEEGLLRRDGGGNVNDPFRYHPAV